MNYKQHRIESWTNTDRFGDKYFYILPNIHKTKTNWLLNSTFRKGRLTIPRLNSDVVYFQNF